MMSLTFLHGGNTTILDKSVKSTAIQVPPSYHEHHLPNHCYLAYPISIYLMFSVRPFAVTSCRSSAHWLTANYASRLLAGKWTRMQHTGHIWPSNRPQPVHKTSFKAMDATVNCNRRLPTYSIGQLIHGPRPKLSFSRDCHCPIWRCLSFTVPP